MFPTCPFLTTGLSKTPCMPRMADWGGLMMGVPNREPNTPPLLEYFIVFIRVTQYRDLTLW